MAGVQGHPQAMSCVFCDIGDADICLATLLIAQMFGHGHTVTEQCAVVVVNLKCQGWGGGGAYYPQFK